ncbi:MAG: LCP family protein [Chloroflexota bacterium]|nr:LCP family protein [Chloroflexota bacterium]
MIGAAIVLFALLSVYLALVIITRVDSIFSPGKQITLPSVFNNAPGIDAKGDSGPKDRINILVMGLDRRPREGDTPTRTDSLFVVTVDPKTKSTGILGIPRDFQIEIPGQNGGTYQDRINTVYVAGELGKYPNGGVGLMKEVLNNDLGIKIDKYVIIDFKGFESVIDDLGGIDVDVPDEVYDPYYSETELPGDYLPQHFYPGKQHMDGQTALAYSRIRFSSDDLDRIQRQQRVIFAAIDKANSINVLKRADSLWSKYKSAVHTDISDFQIPGYALLAADVKDNIHAVSLGPAMYPYTTPQGAEVLLGNKDKIKQIVDSVFSEKANIADAVVTPEPVRVQVQNGTGTEGLASRVVAYIAGKGYSTNDLSAANVFDGASHDQSLILDVGGTHRNNAYLIADWLKIPVANVRDASAAEKTALAGNPAEIVIVVGSDLDFSQLIQSPMTSVPGG